MKKYNLLFVFILTGFGFAQTTSNDIVMENNVNTKFLDSLVLSICNDSTRTQGGVVRQYHTVTFKCAKYQSSYQSRYGICTHENNQYFENRLLKTLPQREKAFNNPKNPLVIGAEVCTFVVVEYGVDTYDELATHIVKNFLSSKSHRPTILDTSYTYGSFSCTSGVWEGQKGIYVTGVFAQ